MNKPTPARCVLFPNPNLWPIANAPSTSGWECIGRSCTSSAQTQVRFQTDTYPGKEDCRWLPKENDLTVESLARSETLRGCIIERLRGAPRGRGIEHCDAYLRHLRPQLNDAVQHRNLMANGVYGQALHRPRLFGPSREDRCSWPSRIQRHENPKRQPRLRGRRPAC